MRWVDQKSYLGMDRRRRRPTLRFGERRQGAEADDAPSLGAALRQLRVRATVARTRHGVGQFVTRTRAIATLAAAYGEAELATALTQLADLAAASSDEDWRERLESALSRLSGRFDAIG